MSQKPPPKEISNLPTRIKGEALPVAPNPSYIGKLSILSGNEKGEEVFLQKKTVQIGRASENAIALTDLAASRKHAQISHQNNTLTLTDLKSGNGTTLNGKRITETPLRHGDTFEIGATKIKLELFAPPNKTTPLPAPAPLKISLPKPPPSVAENITVGLPSLSKKAPKPKRTSGSFGTPSPLSGVLPPIPFSDGVLPPGQTENSSHLPGPFGSTSKPISEPKAPILSPPTPTPSDIPEISLSGPSSPLPIVPPSSPPPVTPSSNTGPNQALLTKADEQKTSSEKLPVSSAAPSTSLPDLPGWINTLSSLLEPFETKWLYIALGFSGIAFIFALTLLLWTPGPGPEERAVQLFEEGITAFHEQNWEKAETLFQESLLLQEEFEEAKQYQQLSRSENVVNRRWQKALAIAPALLTSEKTVTENLSAEQALAITVISQSIPSTSTYGESATRLERKAKSAFTLLQRKEVEELLAKDPPDFEGAAKILLQLEKILEEIPASLLDLIQTMEKQAKTDDWRTLSG